MPRHALIFYGGWDGHQPKEVAGLFKNMLEGDGFTVTSSDSLSVLDDAASVAAMDLIVPVWTMGTISGLQCAAVVDAVIAGSGIAGCHGGMCDAFRENTEWQFLTGGQWVAHPGNDGVKYTVKMGPMPSEITRGIDDFHVASEQYYLHVDPAVKVLATTRFPVADGPHATNGPVDMPVLWTKMFGKGRVFYNALGHQENILSAQPCRTLMRRGFLWAARSA